MPEPTVAALAPPVDDETPAPPGFEQPIYRPAPAVVTAAPQSPPAPAPTLEAAPASQPAIGDLDWTAPRPMSPTREMPHVELELADPRTRRDWAVPAQSPDGRRGGGAGLVVLFLGAALLAIAGGVLIYLSLRG
jgi:hypothetical protein